MPSQEPSLQGKGALLPSKTVHEEVEGGHRGEEETASRVHEHAEHQHQHLPRRGHRWIPEARLALHTNIQPGRFVGKVHQ